MPPSGTNVVEPPADYDNKDSRDARSAPPNKDNESHLYMSIKGDYDNNLYEDIKPQK